MNTKLISAIGFSILVVGMLLNLFCSTKQPSETFGYLNHHDSVKYVGIETCRSCHNDIYKTFIETGMGQSFDTASFEKSAADFSAKHFVYDKYKDLYYQASKRDGRIVITEFRLNGKDTVYKREEFVDYIIGSGQHTNSHMMSINGYVYQMPLTWYAQKKKWDLPPGFEDGHNVRFDRAIGFECMSCHNAMPAIEEHTLNKFVSIPKGIDCERCHGPGELHVKEKLAGNYVDTSTQIDYTIVNPGKLDWERQIDVCQRCHLQGNAVLKPGKKFSDFRPGMELSKVVDIYMPKYKGRDDEFIMASHAQRLQMSQCFIQTKDRNEKMTSLTCISCHNPHVSVKVTGKQVFNNACMNCHQQKGCTENQMVRANSGDNCWGCHMPKSGTIDIPHVSVTDHWIRVPVKEEIKDKLKTFVGIYCINNPQSDKLTKANAYLSYYEKFEGEKSALDSGAVYLNEVNKVSDDELLNARIHLLYLKADYASMVQLVKDKNARMFTNPWTCYRVGQAYQNMGIAIMAKEWYQQSVSLAPGNIDFINKLGAIYVELNDIDAGIEWLNKSLQLNPKQSEPLSNLGFAYLKSGNQTQAMYYYNEALKWNPDFEPALLNKAGLYNYLGQKKEAKQVLLQILKRNPDNAMVKQLLNQF